MTWISEKTATTFEFSSNLELRNSFKLFDGLFQIFLYPFALVISKKYNDDTLQKNIQNSVLNSLKSFFDLRSETLVQKTHNGQIL